VLYYDVLSRLVQAWNNDPNYSHGFVIAPLVGYLLWKRREELSCERGSYLGLAGMAGSFAMLLAGDLGAELFLTRLSLVGMLASVTLLAAGWRGLQIAALPLCLLVLTIPVPSILFNQVAFPLQLLASQAGEATLQAAGIPVLREGNVIVLSTITLEVAEACSGIRSLTSLVSLAIVYGYFTHTSMTARAALIAASIPIAIFANAARVAGTGVAAYYYGAGAAEGFLHTFSGWLIFVAAFAMLLAVDSAIVRRLTVRRQPAASPEVKEAEEVLV
jgi:exosortase